MRAEWLCGFILRRRYYLEHLSIDWFTREHGRISTLVKAKDEREAQPLTLIAGYASGLGRTLAKISGLEVQKFYLVKPDNLWLVFYLNELLLKLLPEYEKEAEIFSAYIAVLESFREDHWQAKVSVRLFEKKLLAALGYGLNFVSDISGYRLEENKNYQFIYHQGFLETDLTTELVFSGKSLLALAAEQITSDTLSEISRLLKYVISGVLGDTKLRSRQVYREISYD